MLDGRVLVVLRGLRSVVRVRRVRKRDQRYSRVTPVMLRVRLTADRSVDTGFVASTRVKKRVEGGARFVRIIHCFVDSESKLLFLA